MHWTPQDFFHQKQLLLCIIKILTMNRMREVLCLGTEIYDSCIHHLKLSKNIRYVSPPKTTQCLRLLLFSVQVQLDKLVAQLSQAMDRIKSKEAAWPAARGGASSAEAARPWTDGLIHQSNGLRTDVTRRLSTLSSTTELWIIDSSKRS